MAAVENASPTIEELIHALQQTEQTFPTASSIVHDPDHLDEDGHRGDQAASIGTRPRDTIKKHLRMLDKIALLLVTKPHQEVAAVTMIQQGSGDGHAKTTFYYAKTKQCDVSEKAHVARIVGIANLPNPQVGVLRSQFHDLVVDACGPKVKSRMSKIGHARKLSGDWRPSTPGEAELKPFFDNEVVSGIASSWNEFLSGFFDQIDRVTAKNAQSPDDDIRRVMGKAYLLDRYHLVKHVGDERVRRRVKKLASYDTACRDLAKLIVYMHPTQIYMQEEVQPERMLPSKAVERRPVLDIVNEYRERSTNSKQRISIDELRRILQSRTNPASQSQTTTNRPDPLTLPSQGTLKSHCECVVAAALRRRIPGTMKIGVSKKCCGPCAAYLSALSKTKGEVKVSGIHGKMYPGWALPRESEDPTVYDALGKEIDARMRDMIIAIDARRGSDSSAERSPPSGSDDEEEEDREFYTSHHLV